MPALFTNFIWLRVSHGCTTVAFCCRMNTRSCIETWDNNQFKCTTLAFCCNMSTQSLHFSMRKHEKNSISNLPGLMGVMCAQACLWRPVPGHGLGDSWAGQDGAGVHPGGGWPPGAPHGARLRRRRRCHGHVQHRGLHPRIRQGLLRIRAGQAMVRDCCQ